MAKDKTMLKIRKLLAQQKGEEALGNIAAAQSFGAKIAELLIKHKIEFAEVLTPEEEIRNPLVCKTVYPEQWGDGMYDKRVLYSEELGNYISGHFFCKCLASLHNNCVLFAGREEDVDILISVFTRIMQAGLSLCEAELAGEILKERDDLDALLFNFYHSNSKFRRSYLAGFNYKIKLRLDEERIRIEQTIGDCTALVRATADVEKYVDEKVGINKEAKTPDDFRKEVDNRAYMQGFKQAESVTIRPNALKQ